MENKTSIFKIVLIGIFVVLLFIGFFLFVTYKPVIKKEDMKVGPVIIWGTLNKNVMDHILQKLVDTDDRFVDAVYVQKNKSTYNLDILEALAQQKSPDLILLSHQDFLKNLNKLEHISYQQLPKREYDNTFLDAFNIYTNKTGIWGIPFLIDPMVMYYNKSMFFNADVTLPPKYWENFEEPHGIVSKIRVLDENRNIIKTAIAMGESLNISHFREILYTLFLQSGNKIFYPENEYYKIKIEDENFLVKAIKLFFEFSNPTNQISYSWNKAMNKDQTEFLAENLAIYFGFSSEIKKIRIKNPNLDFDVAEIPHFEKSKNKSVFAKTWIWAIPKSAKNKSGAIRTAMKLASIDMQKFLSEKLYLPPVRKDLISEPPSEDSFMTIFYKEALYSKSILEQDKNKVINIFKTFVSDVQTGLYSPTQSINNLVDELTNLMK